MFHYVHREIEPAVEVIKRMQLVDISANYDRLNYAGGSQENRAKNYKKREKEKNISIGGVFKSMSKIVITNEKIVGVSYSRRNILVILILALKI